jgi:hypothetical protein
MNKIGHNKFVKKQELKKTRERENEINHIISTAPIDPSHLILISRKKGGFLNSRYKFLYY